MEEDWEVVHTGDNESVDWEEVSRSRSRSRSRSSPGTLEDMEAQLREAQARAASAEMRAQTAEGRTRELEEQLHASRAQIRSLEIVVHQQRIENNNLRTAAMLAYAEPVKHVAQRTRASRDKRVSRALANIAPQNLALPKRKAWGKTNHRTNTTGARHI